MMAVLQPFERRLVRTAVPTKHGVAFIIGPPRSGSTLFYELLVTRFRFSYISNLAHALFNTPAAATFLTQRWINTWRGRFKSTYARIPGWGAPNEGVRVWRRWIPQEHYLDESHARKLPSATIRNTAAAIAGILDAPFLNKNTMHSVHMRLLDRIFPSCVFLEIRRDLPDNVRSIIRMRQDRLGAEKVGEWWSVKPRQWRQYRDVDSVIQACAQVLYTHQNIHADSIAIGRERRHVINYESLCDDPRGALRAVAAFLRARSIHVEERGEIPDRFERSQGQELSPDLESRIHRAIDSMRAHIPTEASATGQTDERPTR